MSNKHNCFSKYIHNIQTALVKTDFNLKNKCNVVCEEGETSIILILIWEEGNWDYRNLPKVMSSARMFCFDPLLSRGKDKGQRTTFLVIQLIHAEPGSFLRQIWATRATGCHTGSSYLFQVHPEVLRLLCHAPHYEWHHSLGLYSRII